MEPKFVDTRKCPLRIQVSSQLAICLRQRCIDAYLIKNRFRKVKSAIPNSFLGRTFLHFHNPLDLSKYSTNHKFSETHLLVGMHALCEWKRNWQENPHRNSWYTQLHCLRSSCLQCEPRLCHSITPHRQSIVHKVVEHKRHPLQRKKFTCWKLFISFDARRVHFCLYSRRLSLCCSQLFLLRWEQFKTPTRFHSYCVRLLQLLLLFRSVCAFCFGCSQYSSDKRHFNKTNVPGGESNVHSHVVC